MYLADMIDYKISNKKELKYLFVITDNFSKYNWCILIKNKKSQTITEEFSKFLTKSKRAPLKIESDRRTEL